MPQYKLCTRCHQKKPATSRFFYRNRKAKDNLDFKCKECRTILRIHYTMAHWAHIKQAKRKYHLAHPEQLIKFNQDPRTKARKIAWKKKKKVQLRQELLDHYGRSCACCGEAIESFLTLDHIYHDGAAHKKRLNGRSGYNIWIDLKKQGWPQGRYRVLCMNCNYAMRSGLICPHDPLYNKVVILPKPAPSYHARMSRKYNRLLRLEMIAAYGGICACCGEGREPFLTLDHVYRDGKAHKQQTKDIYRDLKNRGWPQKRYRLLCWNCNWSTKYGGQCPHVEYHKNIEKMRRYGTLFPTKAQLKSR